MFQATWFPHALSGRTASWYREACCCGRFEPRNLSRILRFVHTGWLLSYTLSFRCTEWTYFQRLSYRQFNRWVLHFLIRSGRSRSGSWCLLVGSWWNRLVCALRSTYLCEWGFVGPFTWCLGLSLNCCREQVSRIGSCWDGLYQMTQAFWSFQCPFQWLTYHPCQMRFPQSCWIFVCSVFNPLKYRQWHFFDFDWNLECLAYFSKMVALLWSRSLTLCSVKKRFWELYVGLIAESWLTPSFLRLILRVGLEWRSFCWEICRGPSFWVIYFYKLWIDWGLVVQYLQVFFSFLILFCVLVGFIWFKGFAWGLIYFGVFSLFCRGMFTL